MYFPVVCTSENLMQNFIRQKVGIIYDMHRKNANNV
jgi:hypothetical protein